ncbi:MAG: HlyD family efflux transporter periplasmic adaptor subunit [Rickettsiales bacterium]
MSKTIKRLVIVVIILIACIAFWAVKSRSGNQPKIATPNVPVVELSEPPQGVGALGRIEPRSRVIDLSHDAGPEGARISELLVQESQPVKKGDVIAVFSDYERKKAKLESARAKVPMLEARIISERANEKFSRQDYERARKLVKTSAVSRSRFDEMERNWRQSQAAVVSLGAELAAAKADLILAEKELEQSTLVSPIDGTILKIKAWPGERVTDAGVVEIADLSQMDVVAEIYERDMPRVKIGQKAEIKVPGMEQPFYGIVRQLGYVVRKNDMNDTDPLADRDNRVVEVRITLDPGKEDILKHLIYMQVDVRVL